MKKVKIYKLIDPISNEVRYVGKTEKTLKHRLSMHVTTSITTKNKTHKEAWISGLYQKEGLRPLIELIEEVEFNLWQEREIYWITQFENLTNLCLGGLGGTGRVYTESERLQKSITMKKLIDEGRIDYKERAKKISVSSKGKIVSEITKEKLRKHNLGKRQSKEQKLKTAKAVLRMSEDGSIMYFESVTDAASKTEGTYKGNISSACNGRLQTYKGYLWKYYEDIVDSL